MVSKIRSWWAEAPGYQRRIAEVVAGLLVAVVFGLLQRLLVVKVFDIDPYGNGAGEIAISLFIVAALVFTILLLRDWISDGKVDMFKKKR